MHAKPSTPPTLQRHQSFGHCTRQLALAGTVIRDTRLPASAELPLHRHAAAYVCIVLAGSYGECARQEIECSPGSIVMHPAGHVHSNRTGGAGARCVNIEFDEPLLDDDTLGSLFRSERQAAVGPSHPSLARLHVALARTDSTAALAAYAAALDVICAALQAPPPPRRAGWMERVLQHLEADLARTPALHELSRLSGVHANHLMRTFKLVQGETIGGYLRRRRLETADAELLGGDRSLASIAVDAGFCDQAHFTRAYGRHFGITPGQRRRVFTS